MQEEEEEENDDDKEEEEVEFDKKEDNNFGEEESDDNAEEDDKDEEDNGIDGHIKEADEKFSDGMLYSKLNAIFAGPDKPNLMILHHYCGKGNVIVRYTPKEGKSVEYAMCDKKDFKTIRHLVKNPAKGTNWRVLRHEISNTKKTQNLGRS